jgi:pimeloyl-ACP methyl ester carboxylesterase
MRLWAHSPEREQTMALPALVLVHGAQHAADCWDPTVAQIQRLDPELTVLAVDLPGRRGKPGDLATARIDDWVDSVVADIDDAGLDEVVIVGHSMAGLTVPGVVAKLGSERVREMILAAAFVPPQGTAFVDTIPGALGWYARRESAANARKGKPATMPTAWAVFTFCNGMTRAQRQFVRERFYPESPTVVLEKVDRSGMPAAVARTWILTGRDRTLSVETQRRCIEALGGVQTLIDLDTCHDLMVSESERLAEILVERSRLYA